MAQLDMHQCTGNEYLPGGFWGGSLLTRNPYCLCLESRSTTSWLRSHEVLAFVSMSLNTFGSSLAAGSDPPCSDKWASTIAVLGAICPWSAFVLVHQAEHSYMSHS